MSTISVDYDVLNQKGSPAWFSDTFANIPTAGYIGRMFISIDTFAFYRDTGTGWDLIGGPGTGTLTGSGTTGQVSFFNGTQTITGNNNLFWDNTNSRLGINTSTPGAPLDIHGTGTQLQLNGTGANNSYLVFQNTGVSKWRIGNLSPANSFEIYNAATSTYALTIASATNEVVIQQKLTIGGQVTILSTLTNNTYTYTLPSATGTLALTSNLSSYLPLAGGTLTGALIGTSATFSGLVSIGAVQTSPSAVVDLTLGLNRYLMWGTSGSAASSVRSWGISNNEVVAGDFVIKSSSTNNNTLDTVRLQITSGGNVSIVGSAFFQPNQWQIFPSAGVSNRAYAFNVSNLVAGDFTISQGSSDIGGTYTTRFIISNAGAVTITNLGTGAVTATSGVLSTTSDMNLKIEDGYIDNALDKILKLTPRYFYWKEESGLPINLRQLGFYAQEVNETLGEEVANTPKTENDKWGIYDRGIIAMITKAIQELNEKLVRNNIN